MDERLPRETAERFIAELGLTSANTFLVDAVVHDSTWTDVLYVDEEGALSPLGLEDHRVVNECARILAEQGAPRVAGIVEAMSTLKRRGS